MAIDFSSLKKTRGSVDTLRKEVEKIKTPEAYSAKDDRFWQPTVDKAGNGSAVIRFLPEPKGEDMPWVRIWNHGFQGPTGKWYIENSLTTIGQTDPVSEINSKLWNSGVEAHKEVARKQKRRLNYISNIYVVKDPGNPENEGKVFLFKFGKKIFDKIEYMTCPEFEDEAPINPFDLWEGANFKLKIRKVDGYRNYDKSEFEIPKPLFEDDKKLQAVWESEYSLQEFLDPKNFKSFDVLKAKLDAVLGTAVPGHEGDVSEGHQESDDEEVEAPKAKAKSAPRRQAKVEEDSADEDLAYFATLAKDD